MYHITAEIAADHNEVEFLFDLAFAPGRHALSSYRLREDVAPLWDLSFVARDDLAVLSGAIRAWPVKIGAADAVLVGPIAVHPTRQGEGLGALLIEAALEAARKEHWSRAVLIGDAPYYQRFGFRPIAAQGISFPPPTNPDRILGIALEPGAFAGVTGMVSRAKE